MSAERKLLREQAKSHFKWLKKTSKNLTKVTKNTPFRAYWQFLRRKTIAMGKIRGQKNE